MSRFIDKRVKNLKSKKPKYEEPEESEEEYEEESEEQLESEEEESSSESENEFELWFQKFHVTMGKMLKPLNLHPEDISILCEELVIWMQKNPMP